MAENKSPAAKMRRMSNPVQMSSRPRSKIVMSAEAESAKDRSEDEGHSLQQQFKHKDLSKARVDKSPLAAGTDRPTDRQVEEAKKSPSGDRVRVIDETISSIVRAHLTTTNYTSTTIEQGLSLYEALTIGHDDTCEVSAMLKVMGPPDPEKLWTAFVENMSATIKRVVAFVKLLPGFPDLDREDKLSLFKFGSFEVIVSRYTKLFTDKGMFVPDMTIRIPRNLVRHMPLGEFFEEQYKFADVFNRLQLNDAETGIVTAVMMMNEARQGLCHREEVRKLRELYLQCLFVLLKRNHPDECEKLFDGVLDVMPLCARINEMHARMIEDVKMNNPKIQFPEIHNQIFP